MIRTTTDTPGATLHHRLIHMLNPEEAKALHPLKRLRPFVAPLPHSIDAGGTATYLWGSLARIDVLGAPSTLSLTFYGPPVLRVRATRLQADDDVAGVADEGQHSQSYRDKAGTCFGAAAVEARGGLRVVREVGPPSAANLLLLQRPPTQRTLHSTGTHKGHAGGRFACRHIYFWPCWVGLFGCQWESQICLLACVDAPRCGGVCETTNAGPCCC